MSAARFRYVVLGAGNAAGYAARAFVDRGVAPGDLCLVGREPVPPYERPALSKAVLVNPAVRLPAFHTCVGAGADPQAPDWYARHGVELRLGRAVERLDAAARTLVLEGGDAVAADDALILATGAEPLRLTNLPGHALQGVHYLRDNADAIALFDALQAAAGRPVVVVGGGYIGMEVAAAAATVGCHVTIVFPEAHLMPRLFPPAVAAHYERAYEARGVKLVNNGRVCRAFLGDGAGRVQSVLVCHEGSPDEELPAALVVVGVGARPTTQLYAGQLDLDERGGVVVDGALKTSVDGVYAVGDIATFPLKMYGDRPARMEHVQNARDSAAHAVKAIVTGSDEAYDYLPYFYSRVFDLSWQFFGDNAGECLVVGDFNPQLLAIWVVPDGSVKGIFMESPAPEDTENMKKVARGGAKVDIDAFKNCDSVQAGWAMLL